MFFAVRIFYFILRSFYWNVFCGNKNGSSTASLWKPFFGISKCLPFQNFELVRIFLINNTFIKQGCITLIKRDSKYIYKVKMLFLCIVESNFLPQLCSVVQYVTRRLEDRSELKCYLLSKIKPTEQCSSKTSSERGSDSTLLGWESMNYRIITGFHFSTAQSDFELWGKNIWPVSHRSPDCNE